MVCIRALLSASLILGPPLVFAFRHKPKWVEAKLSGGSEVLKDEWQMKLDFVVNISIDRDNADQCTGAIIGKYVITAAHCCTTTFEINGVSQEVTLLPSKITVKTIHSGDKFLEVVKVNRHPNYNSLTLVNDVCVLQLCDESVFMPQVKVKISTELPKVGSIARLAGFGTTEDLSSGSLHRAGKGNIKIVQCPPEIPVTEHVCAASNMHMNIASCEGDSGGPWFESKSTARYKLFHSGRKTAIIFGINSFGFVQRDGHAVPQAPDCGDKNKRSGLVPTSFVLNFLKREVPGLQFV